MRSSHRLPAHPTQHRSCTTSWAAQTHPLAVNEERWAHTGGDAVHIPPASGKRSWCMQPQHIAHNSLFEPHVHGACSILTPTSSSSHLLISPTSKPLSAQLWVCASPQHTAHLAAAPNTLTAHRQLINKVIDQHITGYAMLCRASCITWLRVPCAWMWKPSTTTCDLQELCASGMHR